ncbi:MFS transporter [Leucobacter sp. PH1c]|uniref:MFS transporter n=1 Tax=Leucobacter TaxID=55968 RepID=UPI00046890E3|nr:MFS transporter [Leucobacter sp. PH1c]
MTTTAPITLPRTSPPGRMRYGGLIALMAMSFLLVTAEFLPNGVLTEMAESLGVTPGQAGQTVSITALAGLIAAPTIGLVFPRLDRRVLLAGMAALGAVSNLVVALAPSFPLILASRFLLGVAISTFWAMSISVAARLAGPERLGRAIMFTSAGMSLATVAGVPLGVVVSELADWHLAFAGLSAAMAVLAVVVRVVLPPVPAARTSSLAALGRTLVRPGIALGLTGHTLVVLGHFLAYTYIRLALERVTVGPDAVPVDAGTIVLLLALFGAGGLIGNVLVGLIVDRSFATLSVLVPLAIAVAVLTTLTLPGALWLVAAAVFVWGFCFASWLIVVNTWVGHRLPDRLEAGGTLVVMGFQAAITLAAGLGGLVIDALGVAVGYGVGAALLVAGAVLFGLSHRQREGTTPV